MPDEIPFESTFHALTGNSPFPWQVELYRRLGTGDWSRLTACDIPTGLGKTAIIPTWLIALANRRDEVPRRLVYVVNRRTVVDQATDEAARLRGLLQSPESDDPAPEVAMLRRRLSRALSDLAALPSAVPLAISTLRGQFADNREWSSDPARPAIIVGTVDLIGSALLFSSYRAGRGIRPLHAGFLGQDVLLVHDEAHLEPAFQKLVEAIREEQRSDGSHRVKPFHVMALTATQRIADEPLALSEKDFEHPIVQERLSARKAIQLHSIDDEKKETTDTIAKLAIAHEDSGRAILVFVRSVAHAKAVLGKLEAKAKNRTALLVGPLRGYERDQLATGNRVFERFLPTSNRRPDADPMPGTVYLVCTSAGEVGVNISADHMVCDLTPFDSFAQRLGRVNRFGGKAAQVDLVYPTKLDETPFDVTRDRTLKLIQELPKHEDGRHDGSPAALRGLPTRDRLDAASPKPPELETTDILFDAWSLTSIRDLPGRPEVGEYLHGITDETSVDTYFAWREEVELFGGLGDLDRPEATERQAEFSRYLDEYPLATHELLRENIRNARDQLKEIAKRARHVLAWIINAKGKLTVTTIEALAGLKDGNLAGRTVILPPRAGGLRGGILDGKASHDPEEKYDVADVFPGDGASGPRRRFRFTWGHRPKNRPNEGESNGHAASDAEAQDASSTDLAADEVTREGGAWRSIGFWPPHWEKVPEPEDDITTRHLDNTRLPDVSLKPGSFEDAPRLVAFVRPDSADDETRSRFARREQDLDYHLEAAEKFAVEFSKKLLPEGDLREALRFAARHHDRGKHCKQWQNGIGNSAYPDKVLAKSGHARRILGLEGYRHEFGSLLDVLKHLNSANEEVRDVVLHLIAAHHGRGRPHFDADEAFDPRHPQSNSDRLAAEVPQRFARLQRRFGRWGLAYLESLLRAADYAASADLSVMLEEPR